MFLYESKYILSIKLPDLVPLSSCFSSMTKGLSLKLKQRFYMLQGCVFFVMQYFTILDLDNLNISTRNAVHAIHTPLNPNFI